MAYITGKDYVPVTQDRLFSALGMADGQRADAQRALHALCAAGEVRVSKHGRVYANNEEYLCGRFSASTRGFGFVRGREDGAEEIFIPPNATLGAIDGDTVRYTVTSDRPGGRTEGRVSAVLAHAVESVIGTLTEIRSPHSGRIRFALQPDRKQLSFLVYTDNAADVGARAGMKAEARITAYPDGEHDALGHITTVFGPADSADANYTAILHEYGIKTVFDRGVVRLAEERAAAPVLPDGRLDLRDAVIFTVDGAHSKDLDDAISVVRTDEGYELGVHIADVSHYVTEGDPLDLEAFARGTSVYFADQVVPMLPAALSDGACSLHAGEDRYALSAFISLDERGNLLDTTLARTVIRSCVRGVYEEINDYFGNGFRSAYADKYRPVGQMLSDARALYEILAAAGRVRGAMDFETAETEIVVDEDSMPIDLVRRERGVSERMIEQFMLCANRAVACWLYERDMPCVYRVHEPPDEQKLAALRVFAFNTGMDVRALNENPVRACALRDLLDQAKSRGIDGIIGTVLLRSMTKARYSPQCMPHFGLAAPRYCHFTSPIRRYPDLAVHRMVCAALSGSADRQMRDRMARFAARAADASGENERRALAAERAMDELCQCVYMQSRVGQHFCGRISSLAAFGLFVELENLCEGMVPVNTLPGFFTYNERNMTLQSRTRIYRLADSVRVRVTGVDLSSRRIYLELDG